jgi:uncharacterized protein (DUF2062 family)
MKFSKDYILNLLIQALRQGTTPRKLAITCALGAVVGIFPIFGTTTLLCTIIALGFRLNLPIIQLVNYFVTGLQVLLVFPFLKAGVYLFNLNAFTYTREQLIDMLQHHKVALLKDSGTAILAGIGVWLFTAIPLFFILYYLMFFFFRRWNNRRVAKEAST